MSESAQQVRVRSGRPFDRLINFTDAIVAVAITVLVLPIVEMRPKAGEETVWKVIGDNTGQLVTFAFTFIIVAFMWRIHNRIFSRLAGFDDAIFWLNLMWLMLIVLLPWSSSLYGTGMDSFRAIAGGANWFSGGEGLGGAGLLYWLNLGMISMIGGLISAHARRHPELIDPDTPRIFMDSRLVRTRGFVYGVYMIGIGVFTVFLPAIAVWLPFGFFVVGYLLRKQEA
jgi:uncharacterized membrane protein